MDARGYARVVSRWRWLILLITLTCAVTAGLISVQLPRTYQSTLVGLVSPKQLIPPGAGVNPYDANQTPSIDQLVETYIGLMNTAPVRTRLAATGIPRTPDQMRGSILAQRQANTTLINIYISDSDPAVALSIAQHFIPAFNSSLDELQTKVGGDKANHLDALVAWEVPGSPAGLPISPDIPRNILIAAAVGLVAATALAFGLERLDNTIKLDTDVQARLGIPLLGTVTARRVPRGDDGAVELLPVRHVTDPLSEQYRAIRTSLLYAAASTKLHSILVTSTAPGEGKTTTACNLAVVLAQAGKNVILVDADFRRPDIHRVFGLPKNEGLGNLVIGDADEADVLHQTSVPHLRVLPSGPTPPNPSELMGSLGMRRVITHLEKLADYVIFDTAPAGAVTDATVLGTIVDGIVLIVERGGATIPAMSRAVDTLTSAGGTVLGAVLNKAKPGETVGYYYYYGATKDSQAPRVKVV